MADVRPRHTSTTTVSMQAGCTVPLNWRIAQYENKGEKVHLKRIAAYGIRENTQRLHDDTSRTREIAFGFQPMFRGPARNRR